MQQTLRLPTRAAAPLLREMTVAGLKSEEAQAYWTSTGSRTQGVRQRDEVSADGDEFQLLRLRCLLLIEILKTRE